ncbi:GNAT family N-acetyltransferase [bacterium]|nr:GNAT family N-acetyltransferase [bacterium]
MSDYTLRPAAATDLDTVLYHRRRMFEDMGYADPAGQAAMLAISAPMIEQGLADGNYRGWLAETAAGEVVAGGGVIFLAFHPNPADPRPRRAWVVNVFTEPAHRRRGLARRLMEAIVAWCAAEGLSNLYLHASTEGRALYAGMGFTPTSEMRLRLR